jgi:hypothetical protein
MLTLKAFGSGWTPARDAYNGLANFPVSQTGVRKHFCNYCATRISTIYHADVRPSRALTMERLADLRSSDVSPGNGQTSQYKGVLGTNPQLTLTSEYAVTWAQSPKYEHGAHLRRSVCPCHGNWRPAGRTARTSLMLSITKSGRSS